MLAVKGVYKNGTIQLLEQPPINSNWDVVITFLEPLEELNETENHLAIEEATYQKLHPQLTQIYKGEYVAIIGEELVDHDSDLTALGERLLANHPNQEPYISMITYDPIPVYHNRSNKIMRE